MFKHHLARRESRTARDVKIREKQSRRPLRDAAIGTQIQGIRSTDDCLQKSDQCPESFSFQAHTPFFQSESASGRLVLADLHL